MCSNVKLLYLHVEYQLLKNLAFLFIPSLNTSIFHYIQKQTFSSFPSPLIYISGISM